MHRTPCDHLKPHFARPRPGKRWERHAVLGEFESCRAGRQDLGEGCHVAPCAVGCQDSHALSRQGGDAGHVQLKISEVARFVAHRIGAPNPTLYRAAPVIIEQGAAMVKRAF